MLRLVSSDVVRFMGLMSLKGDIGQEIFFLDRGIVDVIVTSTEGESIVVGRHTDGSYFGEFSVLRKLPRTASLRACTHCDMFALDHSQLEEVLDMFPKSRRRMEKRVKKHLQDLIKKSREKGEGSVNI